jgi:pimeloyl-ACP methyl ester carboxylesterase
MQVVVDSLLTKYSRQGKGKSLLVLPGWADNSKSWQAFSRRLAQDYDVIVLDLPGFGGTQAPETAWDLTNYATFVKAFLQKIDVTPSAIIGHSNGGAIAIRGVGSGSLATTKLVLLASAGIRTQYKGRQKFLRLITKTGKLLSIPLPSRAKKRLRRTVYKTIGSDMLVAEHMQATFKKVVEDDVQLDAAKITTPTLLLYGEKDEQAPPQFGVQFHELIDGSVLEIVAGAGHFLQLDQADEILKLIREFLA